MKRDYKKEWANWLFDIGYPFNCIFQEAIPPYEVLIELGLIWKQRDKWTDVSVKEAIDTVLVESGYRS